MYKADLHLHTKVSDGSEDIEAILTMAKDMGITHLSITNHDTTQRTEEYIEKAKKQGILAIPGVEMSAYDAEHGVRAHILGYCYQTTEHIEAIGRETLRSRTENGYKYIEVLNEIGYHVDREAVEKLTTSAMYKQHILAYLMKTGQTDEIFGDVYYKEFKNGGPCSFDVAYPDAVACVKAICADGGIPVLAHPGQQDNFYLLPKLVEAGVKGIEYNHPSHNEEPVSYTHLYYWDNESHDLQKKWFIEQLNLARERNLPINIHSREAAADTMEIMKEHAQGLRGIIHCFSYSKEMAREYVKMGFYIGVGGVVT